MNGSFCTQCGTPAASSGQAMPAPPPVPQPVPGPAPVRRKTSPIVWILVVVLGVMVLGAAALVGTGLFFVHKARQAGLDPELARRNPAYAAAKMIVAMNPDISEVSHNDNAGTITVRDRRTGKEVTLSFDELRHGRLRFTAEQEGGKTASVEFGGAVKSLPAWVPDYPGSTGTFSMHGNAAEGEGGNFVFTTKDSPSHVMQFYQDKARERGMKVNLTATSDEGGTVIASEDNGDRSLTVIVGGSADGTTVNVTYGQKR